jgi:RNA polymerase sigma factor (sigma-70 family)
MAQKQRQRTSWSLGEETDADLLLYMSMSAEEPSAARAAWEEFYRRHAEYLHAVCLRAYGPSLGGEAGAADLVADTFQRAYEHAGTFDAGGLSDRERLRRRTRAWLGRIAQRLAMSVFRGRSRLPAGTIAPEQWCRIAREPAGEESATDGARLAAVRQAVEGLTQKEQTVIRVTFQWYEAGAENQRLPDDVCADLAETLQTTPENLRQIRRRALAKIRAHLLGAAAADERVVS